MGFDISQFFKPVTRLDLATGSLFLYSMTTAELTVLSIQVLTTQSMDKLHAAIAAFTSRQEYDRNEVPHPQRLTLAEVAALPPTEIEQITNALLEPKTFNRLWGVTPDSLLRVPAIEPTQPMHDRIAKLVDWTIAEESNRKVATREAIRASAYGPVQQWIDDAKRKQGAFGEGINELRRSLGSMESGSLSGIKRMLDEDDARHRIMKSLGASGNASSAFAKMQEDALNPLREGAFNRGSLPAPHFEIDNSIFEHQKLMRVGRAKELSDLRLMADASITTARVMNKLSNDVLDFMTKFTEAATTNQSAQTTSVQLALRTFIAGATLALMALIFAILSYFQDRVNNESNDKWQVQIEKLLTQRESVSRELEQLKGENSSIRLQLRNLDASGKKGLQERENQKANSQKKQ